MLITLYRLSLMHTPGVYHLYKKGLFSQWSHLVKYAVKKEGIIVGGLFALAFQLLRLLFSRFDDFFLKRCP